MNPGTGTANARHRGGRDLCRPRSGFRDARWPSVALAAVVEHSGLLREYSIPSHVLGRDSPGTDENSGHDHTKEESTDMGEERDTTATAVRGVNQRGVALEELVQEPTAEEEPCRDSDREPRHERKDA